MSRSKFIKKEKITLDIIPETIRIKFVKVKNGDNFKDDLNRDQYVKIDHLHGKNVKGEIAIFYPEDDVIVENKGGDNVQESDK